MWAIVLSLVICTLQCYTFLQNKNTLHKIRTVQYICNNEWIISQASFLFFIDNLSNTLGLLNVIYTLYIYFSIDQEQRMEIAKNGLVREREKKRNVKKDQILTLLSIEKNGQMKWAFCTVEENGK